MLKVEEKTINGATYQYTQFPAIEGLVTKFKILKLISPILFLGVLGKKALEADTTILTSAIEEVFGKSDPEITTNLIITLITLGVTRKDGKELDRTGINIEFAGKYKDLYQLIGYIIDFNYGKSFFGEGGIGKLLAMIQPISQEEKNY